jgi:hypothetical protein
MVTDTEADENGYGYRGGRKWLRIQWRTKMVTDTEADKMVLNTEAEEDAYEYRGCW